MTVDLRLAHPRIAKKALPAVRPPLVGGTSSEALEHQIPARHGAELGAFEGEAPRICDRVVGGQQIRIAVAGFEERFMRLNRTIGTVLDDHWLRARGVAGVSLRSMERIGDNESSMLEPGQALDPAAAGV
jgi:hypothetical protein